MDKMKYQDRFTEETIYSIDYSDLDTLLCNEYDLDQGDFESCLEQSNDSTVRIIVDGFFDEWDEKELAEFKETKCQNSGTTRLLLKDLCRKGYIDSGTYLIEICW